MLGLGSRYDRYALIALLPNLESNPSTQSVAYYVVEEVSHDMDATLNEECLPVVVTERNAASSNESESIPNSFK